MSGDAPLALLADPVRAARFWSSVDQGKPDECWPWVRALNGSGYGVSRCGSEGMDYTTMAHRVAWILTHKEPIPDGLPLDHLCRNRACCNPGHLRPVTQSQNVRAGAKHLAGDAAVVRVGPSTTRTRGGRRMEIWREYLADGSVRQCGRTLAEGVDI